MNSEIELKITVVVNEFDRKEIKEKIYEFLKGLDVIEIEMEEK